MNDVLVIVIHREGLVQDSRLFNLVESLYVCNWSQDCIMKKSTSPSSFIDESLTKTPFIYRQQTKV
jgi:hypothetical protein